MQNDGLTTYPLAYYHLIIINIPTVINSTVTTTETTSITVTSIATCAVNCHGIHMGLKYVHNGHRFT